ncbi:MAG: hypothetical protein KME60_14780 [Cyanomargarita calcarea GSE-NOS-MK-12-04C]|jgi:hypothetical protein|uniref:Uncharacterized protein n=1 Tax=Cyanomargarita calcarea GSE-NOS-MK-12-04C TaxID=2839659 RepID=A0A951QLW5_9CYAN|nr:hypothetical protein [Cyanomargarita calcarea GSE-NOS-MK-12-04C]
MKLILSSYEMRDRKASFLPESAENADCIQKRSQGAKETDSQKQKEVDKPLLSNSQVEPECSV